MISILITGFLVFTSASSAHTEKPPKIYFHSIAILQLGFTYIKSDCESCISISINWWIFINFSIFTAWNEFLGKELQFITQYLEEIKVFIYKGSTCTTGHKTGGCLWSDVWDTHSCRCRLRSHSWPLAETPRWKSTGQQSERDNWPQSPSDLKNPRFSLPRR